MGGDEGCRVGEVRAGTTFPIPTIRVLCYSNCQYFKGRYIMITMDSENTWKHLFSRALYHLYSEMPTSTISAPLWGDKVSMLTHIYPHKPWRNIEVTLCKSPGWQPTLCVAWCLIYWFALVYKKYGHTWHRMSLLRPDVIKQHKPNQTKLFQLYYY